MVTHHHTKFGCKRHCGSENVIFLVIEEQNFACSLTYAITVFYKSRGMLCTHRRSFRLIEYFPHKYLRVCSINLCKYWSHALWVRSHERYIKNFCQSAIAEKEKNINKGNCNAFCIIRKYLLQQMNVFLWPFYSIKCSYVCFLNIIIKIKYTSPNYSPVELQKATREI